MSNVQVQIRSIREIKQYSERLPDPVKTLILSSPDEMTEDEFLAKFVEWRKLLRLQKAEGAGKI